MPQQGKPMGPFCQSCGMPLTRPEEFGTTAEGWRQNDYCSYCYQDGKFTNPDFTLEQMIEFQVKIAIERLGMSEAEARTLAQNTLPHFKRWRRAD